MKKVILTAILLTISVPAYAQNDLALCRLMAQNSGVKGAAYQPGVDVNGNAVAPADVSAVPSIVPDVIRIPLTVDLAQRLGKVPAGTELKTDMGMVEIHKDGRVVFNGEDWSNQAAVICGGGQVVPAAPVVEEAAAPAPEAVAPAVPVVPAVPARPTKVVVPIDAPAVPMATTPVVSSITVDSAPRAPQPQQPAVLPPQTLGQIIVPANPERTNKVLAAPATTSTPPKAPVAAPAVVPAAPSQVDVKEMGERTNEDLAKDDEIIWGEGN